MQTTIFLKSSNCVFCLNIETHTVPWSGYRGIIVPWYFDVIASQTSIQRKILIFPFTTRRCSSFSGCIEMFKGVLWQMMSSWQLVKWREEQSSCSSATWQAKNTLAAYDKHCISGVPSDITGLNKKHGPYVYPSRTTAAVQLVTFAACILSGHIFWELPINMNKWRLEIITPCFLKQTGPGALRGAAAHLFVRYFNDVPLEMPLQCRANIASLIINTWHDITKSG